MGIEIVYETEKLVVCIKPVNIASSGESKKAMPYLLSQQLNCPVFPVHRLDQIVSGLMVYAKDSDTAAYLTKQINDGVFEKQYVAVCHGVMEKQEDHFSDLLFHDKNKNKSFVVQKERKGVKKAELDYELLESKDDMSAVKVTLQTGRTHQIRVQFASRKHPLVGDGKYGSKDNKADCALISYRLAFYHPKNKEKLQFTYLPQQPSYPFNLFACFQTRV